MNTVLTNTSEESRRAALHERMTELLAPEYQRDLSQSALKAQETRVQNALARLNNLNTARGQKEFYGEKRFDEQYVLLRNQLPDHHRQSTVKHQQEIWRRLPASKFKFFQELFCHPLDRIVPRSLVESDNGSSLNGNARQELRGLSVQPCFVDGSRISDEFAHVLGLAALRNEDGKPFSPIVRLERKHTLEVAQRLKVLFDAATPLERGEYRVLVIQNPTANLAQRYEGIAQEYFDIIAPLIGACLVTRFDEGVGRRVLQLFTDAHSLQRRFQHARLEYQEEMRSLGTAGAMARSGRDKLRDQRHRNGAASELKQASELLGDPTGPQKRSAQNRLSIASTTKDSLGRVNPLTTISRVDAACRDLRDRSRSASSRQSHLEKDALLLENQLASEREELSRVLLREMQKPLSEMNVSQGTKGKALFEDQCFEAARELVECFSLSSDRLNGQIRLRPYRGFLEQVTAVVSALQTTVDTEQYTELRAKRETLLELQAAFSVYEHCVAMKSLLVEGPSAARFLPLYQQAKKLITELVRIKKQTALNGQAVELPFDSLIKTLHGLAQITESRLDEYVKQSKQGKVSDISRVFAAFSSFLDNMQAEALSIVYPQSNPRGTPVQVDASVS